MLETTNSRRSPYGERGLKYLAFIHACVRSGRSPYGERGLKCRIHGEMAEDAGVALLTESVD